MTENRKEVTIDISNPHQVNQLVNAMVQEIWGRYVEGAPLVIAANLSAALNASVLRQFRDPNQLLYAIDKNAVVMEHVIQSLADEVGEDKMEAAIQQMENGPDDDETPEVLH